MTRQWIFFQKCFSNCQIYEMTKNQNASIVMCINANGGHVFFFVCWVWIRLCNMKWERRPVLFWARIRRKKNGESCCCIGLNRQWWWWWTTTGILSLFKRRKFYPFNTQTNIYFLYVLCAVRQQPTAIFFLARRRLLFIKKNKYGGCIMVKEIIERYLVWEKKSRNRLNKRKRDR